MLKGAGVGGLLVSAVLLQLTNPSLSTQAAPPVCHVISSLARMAPDASIPAHPTSEIELSVAGNEYEAAQLIIHAGDSGLSGVDVEVSGPLTTEAGAVLGVESITLYREHYIAVIRPSGRSPLARTGVYPDALIPFRNPFTGKRLGTTLYPSAPFDIGPRMNQAVYVELYAPAGTPAGVYQGSLRVFSEVEGEIAKIPMSVRVRGFSLPEVFSLRTSFQSHDSDYSSGATTYYHYKRGGREHTAVAQAMDEMLIAHRLMPTTPRGAYFDIAPDGRVAPTLEQSDRVLSFLKRPEYTDFRIPFSEGHPISNMLTVNRERAKTYLRSARDWFRAHGVEEKVYLRPGDEPAETAEFIEIRDVALLAREVDPTVKVAMTMMNGSAKTRQYLTGAVNRIVAGYWDYDAAYGAERIAAGDEVWSYTALIQNACEPSPYWLLDFPLLNYRIVNWINYRYGITGLLYWASSFWESVDERGDTLWQDPATLCFGSSCFNGEGMLMYPGSEIDLFVPKGAYGPYSKETVYGPVPSLRLKVLRDAMEDYEYLVLAAKLGLEIAGQEALEIGCAGDAGVNCFHHWNEDPDELLAARERLARAIEGSTSRSARPPSTGRSGQISTPGVSVLH